jgi:hypothetical protein
MPRAGCRTSALPRQSIGRASVSPTPRQPRATSLGPRDTDGRSILQGENSEVAVTCSPVINGAARRGRRPDTPLLSSATPGASRHRYGCGIAPLSCTVPRRPAVRSCQIAVHEPPIARSRPSRGFGGRQPSHPARLIERTCPMRLRQPGMILGPPPASGDLADRRRHRRCAPRPRVPVWHLQRIHRAIHARRRPAMSTRRVFLQTSASRAPPSCSIGDEGLAAAPGPPVPPERLACIDGTAGRRCRHKSR